MIVQLNGEVIENVDPHIGLLHRGSEKLMEDRIYLQSLPYFDRFDYVSMMTQEHAYCLGIESLLGTTNYSSTFVQVRALYDELTRVLNHMLALACHALDVGSMSSIFWAFEEREKNYGVLRKSFGSKNARSFL
jgi:NADH:ubiquinone oxidoreductase subunit D